MTVTLRIKGCLGGPFDIVTKDHEADLTLHFFYFQVKQIHKCKNDVEEHCEYRSARLSKHRTRENVGWDRVEGKILM